MNMRLMLVGVEHDKEHAFQPDGGYWWLRIKNELTGSEESVPIGPRKARKLLDMGVPQVTA